MFGQANFRDVDVALSRKIYISMQGQLFDRFATRQSGKGREIIGTSGTTTSAGGSPHEVQFSGRTIIVTGAGTGGISRRTTIQFNEGFTTCDAHVIFANRQAPT
jgi:hypothetical protein